MQYTNKSIKQILSKSPFFKWWWYMLLRLPPCNVSWNTKIFEFIAKKEINKIFIVLNDSKKAIEIEWTRYKKLFFM